MAAVEYANKTANERSFLLGGARVQIRMTVDLYIPGLEAVRRERLDEVATCHPLQRRARWVAELIAPRELGEASNSLGGASGFSWGRALGSP